MILIMTLDLVMKSLDDQHCDHNLGDKISDHDHGDKICDDDHHYHDRGKSICLMVIILIMTLMKSVIFIIMFMTPIFRT